MNPTTNWTMPSGRELDSTPLDPMATPTRLVACLNVWNDVGALRETMPVLRTYFQHFIAVDGAYEGTGKMLSTDGTREFLQTVPGMVLLDAPGLQQTEKRSRYFSAGRAGDLLFIIDADEMLIDGDRLRSLPACDVGWVRITSRLYERTYGQPRLIRWMPGLRYHGRHHWIYQGHRLLCSHQYGGAGYAHRLLNVTLNNQRHLGRTRERFAVKATVQRDQHHREKLLSAMPSSAMSDARDHARESLQILMHVYRDDGLAPSRLHTALNRTTPHSSVFFKNRPGPFGVQDQYSMTKDAFKMNQCLMTADVVHFHSMMSASLRVPMHRNAMQVHHHHGSLLRANAEQYMKDARLKNALVLVSNLELFSWIGDGIDAHFLPNTVPMARYRALRDLTQKPWTGLTPFRVAHSPSQPLRKGTEAFLQIVARLAARGVPIEAVVLTDMTHREVLREKATCHAMFDSFWLGMQCSGIEAGAMGLPVIAGDETVRDRYIENFGACPYTFANSEEQLEEELVKLIEHADYRASETQRVETYVREYHDEAPVALTYLDLLDHKFGWRSSMQLSARGKSTRPVTNGLRRIEVRR